MARDVKVRFNLSLMDNITRALGAPQRGFERFQKVIGGLGREADVTGRKVDQLDRRMRNFGLSMKAASYSISRYAQPLVNAGMGLIDQGRQFELGNAKIAARVQLTGIEKSELAKQARELGIQTGLGFQAAQEGQLVLGKAGFNFNQIKTALKPILGLSVAEDISSEQAGTTLASLLMQFNMPAEKSKEILDKTAFAANKAKLSITDLSDAFKYLGTQANLKGQTFESMLSMVVALDKAGIRGSSGGQGTAVLLQRLQNPEFLSHLNAAGLEGQYIFKDRAMTQIRPLEEILQYLSTLPITPLMADKFAGTHHSKTFATLMQDVRKGQDSVVLSTLRELQSKQGGWDNSLQKIVDTQLNTLDGQLKILKSTWNDLGAGLEQGGFIGTLKNSVMGLNEALKATPDWMKGVVIAGGFAASGLSTLLDTLGNATIAAYGVGKAFKYLKTLEIGGMLANMGMGIIGLATNPISWIVVGIAVLGLLIWKWQEVKEVMKDFFDWATIKLNKFIGQLNLIPGIRIPLLDETPWRVQENKQLMPPLANLQAQEDYKGFSPSGYAALKAANPQITIDFQNMPNGVEVKAGGDPKQKIQTLDTGKNSKTLNINSLWFSGAG